MTTLATSLEPDGNKAPPYRPHEPRHVAQKVDADADRRQPAHLEIAKDLAQGIEAAGFVDLETDMGEALDFSGADDDGPVAIAAQRPFQNLRYWAGCRAAGIGRGIAVGHLHRQSEFGQQIGFPPLEAVEKLDHLAQLCARL